MAGMNDILTAEKERSKTYKLALLNIRELIEATNNRQNVLSELLRTKADIELLVNEALDDE